MIERNYITKDEGKELIASFINTAETAGITNISEGMTVEQYKEKLVAQANKWH